MSLEGIPRGDEVSMPCRVGKVDEELYRFPHRSGVWLMSLLVDVLDEECGLVAWHVGVVQLDGEVRLGAEMSV